MFKLTNLKRVIFYKGHHKMKKNLPGICFIGCGKISEQHSKTLKKLFPKINLFYADSDNKKAEDYVKKFKGVKSFKSVKEALESDSFEIAFITTPHAFHAEIGIMAAENKKHIITEKPVARNLTELNALKKAVKKNKVRCTVAENYMYKPFINIIRKHIEDGLIGKPLFLEINKTNRDSVSGWRTDEEMMGGGALLEGGVHWVNLFASLTDSKPVNVIAFKPEVEYDTDVPFEDSLSVMVKFENGMTGKLLHSWRIPNRLFGMGLSKIYGTEGVITFESNGLYVSVFGKKKKKSFINPLNFLGFKTMHKTLIEDFMNDKPWDLTLDRITMELKLIESAYKSIESGKLEKI